MTHNLTSNGCALIWDYIREVTERNQALLMGQTGNTQFAD
jgi:hypothetical protein